MHLKENKENAISKKIWQQWWNETLSLSLSCCKYCIAVLLLFVILLFFILLCIVVLYFVICKPLIKFVSDWRQVGGFLRVLCVIKFVSDLRQVGGFLWVLHGFLRFSTGTPKPDKKENETEVK